MAKVIENRPIAPEVYRMLVEAPRVARKRQAGQFVIVRPSSEGERIPLTIADGDPERGTVTLIYQVVGTTTAMMSLLEPGESLADIAGPLGRPTHVDHFGTVTVVGGGIGIAPAWPIARAMKAAGNRVVSILGARRADLLILEKEMGETSDEVRVVTDDGSQGARGLVTDALRERIEAGESPDLVVAIGPVVMMRAVAEVTRPHGIPTLVSLNTIMVDGTGMCGGCRVTVGGEPRFVCVDGPEFDGHLVDFDEMTRRNRTYREMEQESYRIFQERHHCRLEARLKEVPHG